MARPDRWVSVGVIVASLLASSPAWALSRLDIVQARLYGVDYARATVRATTDFAYLGISLSLAYDPQAVDLLEVHPRGTILESMAVDFFQANLFPERGALVVGVLAVASPPFDGRLLPGIGAPLELVHIDWRVRAGNRSGKTALRFVDGLGDPPIANGFAVENLSQPPEEMADGMLDLSLAVSGEGWRFVRGDATQDKDVGLIDALAILGAIFNGSPQIFCMDAADANDDENIDITDPLHLLRHLYLGSAPISTPYPDPGYDPTGPKELGCRWSSYGRF